MKATMIKSLVFNTKALAFTAMLLVAGNAQAVTRFIPIEGGPVEREWIPRIIGRLFEVARVVISGVLEIPPS